jgi:hypothetical protein
MTKSRRLPAPLHPAFVELIRAAWETRRVHAYFVGALYWNTEDGRAYRPPANEMKRLQRLAATLRYDGPILGEVAR